MPSVFHCCCCLIFTGDTTQQRAGTPAGGSVAWTKKSKPGYSPLAGEIPAHTCNLASFPVLPQPPPSNGLRSQDRLGRRPRDPQRLFRAPTPATLPGGPRRLPPGANLAPAVWISNPGAPPAAIGTAATPAARSAASRLAISGRRFHTEPASFFGP